MKRLKNNWLLLVVFSLGVLFCTEHLYASSSLRTNQLKFTEDLAELITYATTDLEYKVFLGEVARTPAQQEIYLKQGKSKTAKSKHLDNLAADLNVFVLSPDGHYIYANALPVEEAKKIFKPLAEYWKKLSTENTCGYFWGWDFGHFERSKD